jgi:uncharacterized protein
MLASIRKAVDSDIDSLTGGMGTRERGTLMRGALREMRINMSVIEDVKPVPRVHEDLADLRSRIRQKMVTMQVETTPEPEPEPEPAPPPPVAPTRSDFSGIMSGPPPRLSGLRPSYSEDDAHEDIRFAPAPEWEEQAQQGYGYEQHPDPYAQQGYGYPPQHPHHQPHYPPRLEGPIVSPQTEAHTDASFKALSDAILARVSGDRSLEDITRDMLRTMLKQWLDANLPGIVEDMVREEIQRVARRGR